PGDRGDLRTVGAGDRRLRGSGGAVRAGQGAAHLAAPGSRGEVRCGDAAARLTPRGARGAREEDEGPPLEPSGGGPHRAIRRYSRSARAAPRKASHSEAGKTRWPASECLESRMAAARGRSATSTQFCEFPEL